jgi:hypothetical protein
MLCQCGLEGESTVDGEQILSFVIIAMHGISFCGFSISEGTPLFEFSILFEATPFTTAVRRISSG